MTRLEDVRPGEGATPSRSQAPDSASTIVWMHREPVRDAGPDRLEWMARAWHEHFEHERFWPEWETCEATVCREARAELEQIVAASREAD